MGVAAAVDLPNAICAVGMAGSAVHHAEPEHLARPRGGQVVAEHFKGGFAVDHGHDWLVVVRLAHGVDGGRNGSTLAVGSLEHVEVEKRNVIYGIARAEAIHARGM